MAHIFFPYSPLCCCLLHHSPYLCLRQQYSSSTPPENAAQAHHLQGVHLNTASLRLSFQIASNGLITRGSPPQVQTKRQPLITELDGNNEALLCNPVVDILGLRLCSCCGSWLHCSSRQIDSPGPLVFWSP